MKNRILRNWTAVRWIRLALGVLVAIQGAQAGEWLIFILGGLFALMPLLNVGCANSCGLPQTEYRSRSSQPGRPDS